MIVISTCYYYRYWIFFCNILFLGRSWKVYPDIPLCEPICEDSPWQAGVSHRHVPPGNFRHYKMIILMKYNPFHSRPMSLLHCWDPPGIPTLLAWNLSGMSWWQKNLKKKTWATSNPCKIFYSFVQCFTLVFVKYKWYI